MENELAAIFQALAHPTRVTIVKLLSQGDMCVCELTAALQQPQGHVSRHLTVLRTANLVKPLRKGNKVYYSLSSELATKLIEAGENMLGRP